MKKAFLLSFVVLTFALTIGCSNGLPRNCAMRKWFCGKECASEPAEQTVYYPPVETCPACTTCTTGVVVSEPIVQDSSCSTCSSCPSCNIPSLPAQPATGTGTTPAPAPISYNN